MSNNLRGAFSLPLPAGEVDVLLNLNALRLCTEAEGIELGELLEKMAGDSVTVLPKLLFAAYKNKVFLTGGTPVYEFEQFAAQVGTLDIEAILENVQAAMEAGEQGKATAAKAAQA
tara:strand:+ start:947 stop:1294 length:348 start_codon:yes stop_codon:yes gene_type:complete